MTAYNWWLCTATQSLNVQSSLLMWCFPFCARRHNPTVELINRVWVIESTMYVSRYAELSLSLAFSTMSSFPSEPRMQWNELFPTKARWWLQRSLDNNYGNLLTSWIMRCRYKRWSERAMPPPLSCRARFYWLERNSQRKIVVWLTFNSCACVIYNFWTIIRD